VCVYIDGKESRRVRSFQSERWKFRGSSKIRKKEEKINKKIDDERKRYIYKKKNKNKILFSFIYFVFYMDERRTRGPPFSC
jgi:hypothetical protein